jgi:Uri superfamily endonuclease
VKQVSFNDRQFALANVEARPGSYALLLSSATETVIPIGRLGNLRLQPGFYVYIGSALGPGGVRARLAHHTRRAACPHWHIDYLKLHTRLEAVWFCYGRKRLEHIWARHCSKMPGASVPMAGFGSSDCDCESHLFFLSKRPRFASLHENGSQPVKVPLCAVKHKR